MLELVFLHGGGDSAGVWEQQLAEFGGLALDLPGHGSRLAEQAHDNHLDNAREVVMGIERRNLKAPVVVGHSMGGAVALTLAHAHAEVPQALVLVSTGARMRMRPDLLEKARQRAESAAPGEVAGPTVHVDNVLSPTAAPGIRQWVTDRTGNATAQAVYADFVANDRFDVMSELGRIALPTLIVGGADDQLTPPKFLQYLADHIPGAWLEMIPQAGHYPFVERPGAFNLALKSFLVGLARY